MMTNCSPSSPPHPSETPPRHDTHYEDMCLFRIITTPSADTTTTTADDGNSSASFQLLVALLDQHVKSNTEKGVHRGRRTPPLIFTRIEDDHQHQHQPSETSSQTNTNAESETTYNRPMYFSVKLLASQADDNKNDGQVKEHERKDKGSLGGDDDTNTNEPANQIQIKKERREDEQENGTADTPASPPHATQDPFSHERKEDDALPPFIVQSVNLVSTSTQSDHLLILRVQYYQKVAHLLHSHHSDDDNGPPAASPSSAVYQYHTRDFPAAVTPLVDQRFDVCVNNVCASATATKECSDPSSTTATNPQRAHQQVQNITKQERVIALNEKMKLLTKTAEITDCIVVGTSLHALQQYLSSPTRSSSVPSHLTNASEKVKAIHTSNEPINTNTSTAHMTSCTIDNNTTTSSSITPHDKALLCDVARFVSAPGFIPSSSSVDQNIHLFTPPAAVAGRPPPTAAVTNNDHNTSHDEMTRENFLFNCDMLDFLLRKQNTNAPAATAAGGAVVDEGGGGDGGGGGSGKKSRKNSEEEG